MTMTGIRRWGLASVVVLSGWLAGCASITHGTEQTVKLETRTEAGEVVTQADCQMSNDKGTASAPSGVETKVRRSGGNLMVRCTHPNHPAAVGQAISRANVGMVGNIMIGGLIGVAVDAGTGGGFSYPNWMQLVFGQERLFDRIENRGDGPTPAPSCGRRRTRRPGSPLPRHRHCRRRRSRRQRRRRVRRASRRHSVRPAPIQSAPPPAVMEPASPLNIARAEDFARQRSCHAAPQASFVGRGTNDETFTVACDNGYALLVMCVAGGCQEIR